MTIKHVSSVSLLNISVSGTSLGSALLDRHNRLFEEFFIIFWHSHTERLIEKQSQKMN